MSQYVGPARLPQLDMGEFSHTPALKYNPNMDEWRALLKGEDAPDVKRRFDSLELAKKYLQDNYNGHGRVETPSGQVIHQCRCGGGETVIVERTVDDHEYSCVMMTLDDDTARAVKGFALDESDVLSREAEPHVTVLYGLHTDDAKDVEQVIANMRTPYMELGKVIAFPAGADGEPLVVEVKSPELEDMNKALARLPNTQSFDKYRPHVTIAYLRPGAGARYAGQQFPATFVGAKSIQFSNSRGDVTTFPLKSRWQT